MGKQETFHYLYTAMSHIHPRKDRDLNLQQGHTNLNFKTDCKQRLLL